MEGRNFVARPSVAAAAGGFGTPAQTPIAHVGLDSAPTAQERAALAVKSSSARAPFDRKLLVVAGTTGTGWLEPQTMDTIEYEWNGDTAIVGIQYSFLPWISTLVGASTAADAGRAIYDAVYAEVAHPAGDRPEARGLREPRSGYSIQAAFPTRPTSRRAPRARSLRVAELLPAVGMISAARARQPAVEAGLPEGRADPVLRRPRATLASPARHSMARRAWRRPARERPCRLVEPAAARREPDWLAEPPGPGRSPDDERGTPSSRSCR